MEIGIASFFLQRQLFTVSSLEATDLMILLVHCDVEKDIETEA
jgi:hypothetical protein